MKFKKSLLIICLLACVLFAVGSVSAGDVNDTAIAIEDTDNNIDYLSLPAEEVAQNNVKTGISEEITNDEQILTNTDEDNLAEGSDSGVKITCYQSGTYVSDKKIYFNTTDAKTGKGLQTSFRVNIFENGAYIDWASINTNSNGIGVLEWDTYYFGAGTFKIENEGDTVDYIAPTGDDSGHSYKIDPSSFKSLTFKVSEDKTTKTTSKKTTTTKTTSKKTTKSTLSISAPKVTKNYKKSGIFKVTVKNQKTKKAVKGITLKIKVYTNSKYKTYSLKTNKNGVAKINTKSLKKGTHKVVVTAKATKKYKAKTVKSSIKIIKKQTTTSKNGKIQTTIKVQCDWHLYRSSNPYPQVIYDTFKATLTGKDGKVLDGEYKALIAYYRSGESSYYARDKIEGYYGSTVTHEVGQWYYSGAKLVLTIEFAGNDKYAPTTFTKTL